MTTKLPRRPPLYVAVDKAIAAACPTNAEYVSDLAIDAVIKWLRKKHEQDLARIKIDADDLKHLESEKK